MGIVSLGEDVSQIQRRSRDICLKESIEGGQTRYQNEYRIDFTVKETVPDRRILLLP